MPPADARVILKHPITGREIHARAVEWLLGAAYFHSARSGVQWLDPLPSGGPVFPDFSAYADELLGSATPGQIAALLPPNECAALEWVRESLSANAKIVELFAETGRFARQLQSSGYTIYLADPLAAHVAVLRKHAFTAVCATNPAELPADWSDAEAVIILESIVRVPRPGEFMAAVRAHFPRAKIYLTAPSLRRPLKMPGVDHRTGYPPDFLTRWTAPALRELLDASGYESRARRITPRMLRSAANRGWRGRMFVVAMILLMAVSGEYEFSVSAWGRPRESLP